MRQQGVAVGEGQPEVLATPPWLGERAADEGRLEVVGAWQMAADGARMEHLDPSDLAATDSGREAPPDDLDLGQFRHLPSVWDRGGTRRALQCGEGYRCRVLLGFLLVPTGARAVAPLVDPDHRLEGLGVIGTRLDHLVYRHAETGQRGNLLKRGLQSSPAPRVATSAISESNRWWTKVRAASIPCQGRSRRITASIVSARIDDLSRPRWSPGRDPAESPHPGPSRGQHLQAREFTTAARSLASWPSDRSG